MSLRELSFQHEYRSDKTSLIDDFYTPCLKKASQYCRAVAYFTSNGLQKIVNGLPTFIQNGGRISLVTGPKLMVDDIEAIKNGYEARKDLFNTSLGNDFADVSDDRLRLLSWLIAREYFDIKIALPSEISSSYPRGVYHEKIGVFLDNNDDAVAFSGSSNETVGGLLSNFESIDVHWSWNDVQERVQQKINNFHRLWDNNTDRLKVVDFQEALNEDLLIRQTVYETEEDSTEDRQELVESSVTYLPDGIELRNYQVEAIDAWFQNGCRGIWEMATGTGKTITALSALARLREEKQRLFVLIVCPYQHLVDQWHKEVLRFGFEPILAYKNSSSWIKLLSKASVQYNWHNLDVISVITTAKTFTSEKMQKIFTKNPQSAVLIADEVHHLGATGSREKLTDIFVYRLGLTATLERWFDDEGTDTLNEYFGETVFNFPLDRAIKEGFLCQYEYHPHIAELTDKELEEYERLTEKISKQFYSTRADELNEPLKHMLRKRAKLLNNAEKKLPILLELLVEKTDMIHHTLFYCAPQQINSVLSILIDLGVRVNKFTAQESTSERLELLDMFASGHLQALVAMKCLDEGVDVPSTQTAYILASSSNPKEFIQRRGRILRKTYRKEKAEIHDLIAVPPSGYNQYPNSTYDIERKIVEKELKRFNEFAALALNKNQSLVKISELARIYNLLGLLGEK